MTAAEKDSSYTGITGRFRKALLFSDLPEADKLFGIFLVEHTNGDWYRENGALVTWIGVPKSASLMGRHQATIKKGRARLRAAGILSNCYDGGHGPGDTSQMVLSLDWLAAIEETLRKGGQLARSKKGGKGDRAATHPGLFDDTVLLEEGDGPTTLTTHFDTTLEAVWGEGDGAATLSGVDFVPEAVDETAFAPASVDNSGLETAMGTLRVAGPSVKGDSPVPIRVAEPPPEPLKKPGSNPARLRARGPRRPAEPPKPADGQMSIMLPLPGGQVGKAPGKTLKGMVAANRALAVAKADGALELLLHRAGALLGDRAAGNLAVAALQSEEPGLYQEILAGKEIADDTLRVALHGALAVMQNGMGAPATTVAAPPPEPRPAPTAGLSEAVVASTVAQVLAAMVPDIVAATLAALGIASAPSATAAA